MSSRSRGVKRFFAEVQRLITEWSNSGLRITTPRLQQAVFGDAYDPDSRYQHHIIHDCIEQGRQQAIQLWATYLVDEAFVRDGEEIRHYHADKIEAAMDHDDFVDFAHELNRGKFGKDASEIRANLVDYGITACLFDARLNEFSAMGNNLLVATYGKESEWFIPSFWRWCIRDYNLYRRTIRILHMQLERGKATGLLLPSGVSIEKALRLAGVTRAALEDGTAWKCPQCKLHNPSNHKTCANCETPKPE